MTENFSAYSILDHRHVPEVLLTSGIEEAELSFTAQLLPLHRGILETIYFRARNDQERRRIARIVRSPLRTRAVYSACTKRVICPTFAPSSEPISATSEFSSIAATGRAVVVSAIDNLVKGAAGQAIQNMNLAFGLARDGRTAVKLVIKLGGTLLDSAESRSRIARELAAVHASHTLVVVHGGGKQMTRYLEERGIQERVRERPARHHGGNHGRAYQGLGR